MSADRNRLRLPEIEDRVLEIVARQTGWKKGDLDLGMSLIGDLGLDSLAMVELVMEIEETFDITIPDEPENPVSKQVFTRAPFRLRDLAETIFLQSQEGRRERREWTGGVDPLPAAPAAHFTQLGGALPGDVRSTKPLYERIGENGRGYPLYRRQADGMQCVLLPGGAVEIGSSGPGAQEDEGPVHETRLAPFLVDVEPVSTTAYARFLNSIGAVDDATLRRWFVLEPGDRRAAHMPIDRQGGAWRPFEGAERWPMVLVSWYGANAYALWANGRDPRKDATVDDFLPTEAQWEYAARGPRRRRFPWGDEDPTPERARVALHQWRRAYALADLPLADVNEELGLSPFGLRHMAGNVWQWCRDAYDRTFYSTEAARRPDPVCRSGSGTRSERGGSWIGPADLARSSYRRGRPPLARGRCLGFRCVGDPQMTGSIPGKAGGR